jgi:hypothetical protein
METGHSTIFTMHAGEPINAVNRLVTKYLMMMPALGVDVVERIIGSAVDFVAIQDHIPGMGRKVSIITQVKFDDYTKRIVLEDLLKFDFDKEDWVWLNRIDDNKCRNLMRRGVSKERVAKWRKTDNPEIEEKAIKELNETYYAEKEERQKRYQIEHDEKIRRKEEEHKKKAAIRDVSKEEALLNQVEAEKNKEFENMQKKLECLSKNIE